MPDLAPDQPEPENRLDFTPAQEAYMRWFCGFGPEHRELTAWDLIAAIEAARTIETEWNHIRLFEPDLLDGTGP